MFLEVKISWQAQHFVNLHVQISWQVQHFVNLPVQISWQAQHFVHLYWRLCSTTLVRGVSVELEAENWRLSSTTLVRGAICRAGS